MLIFHKHLTISIVATLKKFRSIWSDSFLGRSKGNKVVHTNEAEACKIKINLFSQDGPCLLRNQALAWQIL